RVRQSEHDVVIGHGQQLIALALGPLAAGPPLALGAMPITAAVMHVMFAVAGLAAKSHAAHGRRMTGEQVAADLAPLPVQHRIVEEAPERLLHAGRPSHEPSPGWTADRPGRHGSASPPAASGRSAWWYAGFDDRAGAAVRAPPVPVP